MGETGVTPNCHIQLIRNRISLLCNGLTLQPLFRLLHCNALLCLFVLKDVLFKVRPSHSNMWRATASITCRKLLITNLIYDLFFPDACSTLACDACEASSGCSWVNCTTCEYLSQMCVCQVCGARGTGWSLCALNCLDS